MTSCTITIKTKHIILFFILVCVVLSIVKIFEEDCEMMVLDSDISGVVRCRNSNGESMNFPDNACHLYGEPENIFVGDVISFNKGNVKVLHRVIKIENIGWTTYYTTQGDNNLRPDKPITLKQINYKLLGTVYFDD